MVTKDFDRLEELTLEEAIELRNWYTRFIARMRKEMRMFGRSIGLDSKVFKEAHFERDMVRDRIDELRKRWKKEAA